MQKFAASLLGFLLIISTALPAVASAQTSLEANLTLIQNLTNQIKALQEQIKALQAQQVQIQTTANQAIIEIIQGLREGSEGDQVTLLQTLLAADAALYPEGRITGYFGPLTRRALQRFQQRHGLETVGFVGPRTREALNRFIREQFKIAERLEDDIAEEVENAIEDITLPPLPSDPCAIPGLPLPAPIYQKDGKTKLIQTGNVFIYQDGKHKIIITPNTYFEKDGKKKLLITPGMRIEKDGKFKSIIPCNGATSTYPFPTPTPGTDTTPPTLSAIQSSATHQGASITWITNETATGKVYYGTTTPLNLGSANTVSNSSLQTGHSFTLTGLESSMTHYFVVESKDKKGNTATSSQQSFTTSATPDTTAPSVTAISASNVGTSTAIISWTTNENANSKVYYGTTTPLNTGTASSKSDNTLMTSHSLALTGLTPGVAHYFKVESKDAANNTTLSSETSFTTTALPVDATAPVISAVVTTPASTTAQVTWTTDEAATSKVYYSTTTPLVLGTASTVSQGAFLTSHSLSLTSLTASTTYYMIVESKDAANNTAVSTETSFLTGS